MCFWGRATHVDVEAPPPADVVGKGTTNQRPNDGCDSKDATEEALIHGTLRKRNHRYHDDNVARPDAGRSQSGDRAADNEGFRVGCCATQGGTDFEDEERGEIDDLGRIEGVDAAKEELEGTAGDEVGTSIPSHIAEGMEVVGDGRYGSTDDGAILYV